MKALSLLLARLREPSTMAGLSALLVLAGRGNEAQAITDAVGALAGVAAIFIPERS